MTDDISLFDGLEIPKPPMIRPNDKNRTGKDMPLASHAAADRSQKGLPKLRRRVLILVRENPLITGADLNEMYRQTYKRRDWDWVSFDGPRKRAGEMADPSNQYGGLLINAAAVGEAKQFIISEAGLKVVTS